MPVRVDRLRLRAGRWWRWARRVSAVGLLVTAALLAQAGPSPVAEPTDPRVAVLAASRALPPGHLLVAADVRVVDWPAQWLPPDAFAAADDATGRVLAAALHAGEPISEVRLVGPGLATALGPGLRAVPVRLTDVGVSELLQPGDRIDLYAVDTRIDRPGTTPGTAPGGSAGDVPAAPAGTLVAADLLVVALSRTVDGPIAEGSIVVLAVPLDTVAALVGAAYSRSLAATLAPP